MGAKQPAGCGHLYTRSITSMTVERVVIGVVWCCYCGALCTLRDGRRSWELPLPPPRKTKGSPRRKSPSPATS